MKYICIQLFIYIIKKPISYNLKLLLSKNAIHPSSEFRFPPNLENRL